MTTVFRVSARAVLLTWSALWDESPRELVHRVEVFCRTRPNHWRTLAVVERHNPDAEGYDPEHPLHVHALTLSENRNRGWNTANPHFWDWEGNHPNIAPKGLRWDGGGVPAMTAFDYLWKAMGEQGEEVNDLMAGELTREDMEELVGEARGGRKRSRMVADLEDGTEIVSAEMRKEYFETFKRVRPLAMLTAWTSVRAYAEYTYPEDLGLEESIPVDLPILEDREHIDWANEWFAREVPEKGRGMRHKILVIEGETGTGKTTWARSKGPHSRMCGSWNVEALSEEADVWILDDMVPTSGKYSLKALSQWQADFTGKYKKPKQVVVRPTVILGNSRSAITCCWSDIEGPEGEAWLEKNVTWVVSGDKPFFVFP